ncbi:MULTISPECIES: putative signal transducing protein [Parabacteroides]|jgi:hypothetical protein|uniref:DUF2007 domain-containing protein n=1 Tax=Parabacteroides faecis TaxID=1217282 RepID=A0ABR6KP31_9BACT|nr:MULTISPECIES: DUF2007 domain-containing protein [Parabacteroides]MBB4623259.1 hypothetical protein [Parabacteroides faecis]MBC8617242.1 DUF2007 domain-containing protein [Parabacteroides faecis]MCS2893774.1 DUF2007 domain-containing protein [Parabacteroides faecis]RHR43621.1 DUF2007 domain-containing protein [Parabacteroides sp. AF18-52]RHS01181.1 DUF2007 domain-containing protein [Parabacteroides sp. AF14-59]
METVYLATLDNDFQATLLSDLLRNDGIESFLKNEIISSVLNIPGFQIEIYVMEKDYEKAKEILTQAFPELVGKE